VNHLYWQLRDLHYPESPLNVLCMPTQVENEMGSGKEEEEGQGGWRENDETKQIVKGEIINFIFRTAR
jgi:hypothetical protein